MGIGAQASEVTADYTDGTDRTGEFTTKYAKNTKWGADATDGEPEKLRH